MQCGNTILEVDIDVRNYEAETFEAEEKGKRKIGEVVAWNNSIIGMDGKWRNGKYDL